MQTVKKDEFLGLIIVLEHLAKANRPNQEATAAIKVRSMPTKMPEFLKTYGIANKPAPTMVLTRFTVDEFTVAVGGI